MHSSPPCINHCPPSNGSERTDSLRRLILPSIHPSEATARGDKKNLRIVVMKHKDLLVEWVSLLQSGKMTAELQQGIGLETGKNRWRQGEMY